MTEPVEYELHCSKGGDNTYTHACEVYGGQRHYAMCLKVIGRCNDPSEPMYNYDEKCRKAVNVGPNACPALALRAKEEQAGRSLYYVPREKTGLPPIPSNQIFTPSYERGYRGNRNAPPRGADRVIPSHSGYMSASEQRRSAIQRPSAPAPKPAPKLDTSNLHGELVNKMLKEETK